MLTSQIISIFLLVFLYSLFRFTIMVSDLQLSNSFGDILLSGITVIDPLSVSLMIIFVYFFSCFNAFNVVFLSFRFKIFISVSTSVILSSVTQRLLVRRRPIKNVFNFGMCLNLLRKSSWYGSSMQLLILLPT